MNADDIRDHRLTDEVVRRWAWLHDGNRDVYGDAGPKPLPVRAKLTPKAHLDHLCVGPPIGVYPLLHTEVGKITVANQSVDFRVLMFLRPGEHFVVRWGAIDFDTPDREPVLKACAVLEAAGVTPWVEQSRGKGWHVWVYPEDWISARVMRRAMLAVLQLAGLDETIECYPKQDRLDPDQIGNFLRLPYPAGSTVRQRVYGHWTALAEDPLPVEATVDPWVFVDGAWESRAERRTIAALAARLSADPVDVPAVPVPVQRRWSQPAPDVAKRAVDRLGDEVRALANTPSGQRNNQLNRVAFAAARQAAAGVPLSAGVRQAIAAAASNAGLKGKEVTSTMRSAEKAGAKHPWRANK